MTTMTEQQTALINDPEIRSALARLYIAAARGRATGGYQPSDKDGRLLRIAANWETVRDNLALWTAITLTDENGESHAAPCSSYPREFRAAVVMAKRAMDRWRTAYQAAKADGEA